MLTFRCNVYRIVQRDLTRLPYLNSLQNSTESHTKTHETIEREREMDEISHNRFNVIGVAT